MSHSCKEPPNSAVLESIQELIGLERARMAELEEVAKKRQAQETLSRLAREERARQEREARLRADDERRHAEAHRRKLQAALVEAADEAEWVRRRLEQEHRLRMARLAEEHAASVQYWKEEASRTRRAHPAVLAVLVLALIGVFGVLMFFVAVKPARDAEEILRQAAAAAGSDEPAMWDEADRLVALAKTKDRGNFAAIGVEETLAKKRAAQIDKDAMNRKRFAEAVAELQKTLADKAGQATPTKLQLQHHDRRKERSPVNKAWGQPMQPSS